MQNNKKKQYVTKTDHKERTTPPSVEFAFFRDPNDFCGRQNEVLLFVEHVPNVEVFILQVAEGTFANLQTNHARRQIRKRRIGFSKEGHVVQGFHGRG